MLGLYLQAAFVQLQKHLLSFLGGYSQGPTLTSACTSLNSSPASLCSCAPNINTGLGASVSLDRELLKECSQGSRMTQQPCSGDGSGVFKEQQGENSRS